MSLHGGYKRALPRCTSGHLAEFIAVSACFVWEDARVRLRLLWFSQVRLAVSQCPIGGMLKVLVEYWLLLSKSPVEDGKSGRKTSTVVSDDMA